MGERAASQWQWPLWGVAAGVLGYVGHLLTGVNSTNDQRKLGAEAVTSGMDSGPERYFAVVPFGFLVATGLPGFPGVVDPLWLIVTSIGLAQTFRRQATVRGLAPRGALTTESGSLVS